MNLHFVPHNSHLARSKNEALSFFITYDHVILIFSLIWQVELRGNYDQTNHINLYYIIVFFPGFACFRATNHNTGQDN